MDIIPFLFCIYALLIRQTSADDSFKLVTLGGQKAAVNQKQKAQIWRGDIYPGNELLSALKATASGVEVILVTDARLEAVAHTHASLARLGLNNMLWQSPDAERCHRAEVIFPELPCVWSSQPLPSRLLPPQRMSLKRIMLLARIVRLGYNVLSIDADTVVLRDPYPFLKAPPLKDKNLIIMRGSRGTLAPGIMYVQNAYRHGPVAWALAEAAMRNLHWADAGIPVPSAAALNMPDVGVSDRGVVTCELSHVLMDTLVSTMARKATHWQCFRPSVPPAAGSAPSKAAVEAAAGAWDKQHLAALGLAEGGSLRDLFTRDLTRIKPAQDPELVRLMAAASYTLLWATLGIPADPAAVLVPLPPEAQAALMLGNPVFANTTSKATSSTGASDRGGGTAPTTQGGPPTSAIGTAALFQQLLASDRAELRRRVLSEDSNWLGRQSPSHRIHALQDGSNVLQHNRDSTAGSNTEQGELHQPTKSAAKEAAEIFLPDDSWTHHHRGARSLKQQAQVWSTGHGIEQFAFAPDWLFGTWLARGVYGFWDPRTSGTPPRQVLGHMSRVPGHTAGKDTLRMASATFNWTVASRLQSSVAAALHSSLHPQEGGKGKAGAAATATFSAANVSAGHHSFLPRMVALSPESPLLATARTRAEWVAIVQGLAQVAALSGRMMVWPDPLCSSPWIQPQPAPRGKLPLQPNHAFLPHGPLETLRCTPATVLTPHCLYDRSAPGGAWQWWHANQAGASDSLAEHLKWRAGSSGLKRTGAAGGAAAGRKQATQRQQKHQKIGGKAGGRQLHVWTNNPAHMQTAASKQSVVLGSEGLPQGQSARQAHVRGRHIMSGGTAGAAGPSTSPNVLRGMLWLEFEHVSQLLPEDFRSPWAANTLHMQAGAGQAAIQKGMMDAPRLTQRPQGHRHLSSTSSTAQQAAHGPQQQPGGSTPGAVLDLAVEDVVVELAKVNHQPVVYLTQAVRVHLTGQAQAAYTAFQQGCKGLWESDTAPRVMSRQ